MPLPLKMDYAELGGEKEDYEAVVDSETELSAEEINATRCAVAMMSRMVPRAMVSFSYAVSVTVEDHEAVWGNDASYAPSVVRNSVGDYTITWPATVVDERGDEHSVNITRGNGQSETAPYVVHVQRTSATTVDVAITDATDGALSDAGSAAVTVWVWTS